ERSKLRLIEQVVDSRRTAAEWTRRAVWTVVPEQLEERVVDDIGATDRFLREERVSGLRRRQRRVSPPVRHEWEEVVEERDVGNGGNFPVRIAEINQPVDRFVVSHPRLWVADVVELHDVARSEQVTCEASDVTGFKSHSLAEFTTVREVEA